MDLLGQEIAAKLDQNGQPTGAYWIALARNSVEQTDAAQAMRKMMMFFTVLAILGIILGFVGAIELGHAASTASTYAP